MDVSLSEAASLLKEGKVVAVPTETVYGLAASLDHPDAIEQVFALKGRHHLNPLIIHMAHVQDLHHYILHYPPHFNALAEAFWPGPLTCILPVQISRVPPIARACLPTAGFRIPALQLTRDLLQLTGPLVMPSANLSGKPSATRPEHVKADFGPDLPILDGGICKKGVESTILFYDEQDKEWVIVRLGALAPEMFKPVLGYEPRFVQRSPDERPLSPGQLFRHYAPNARLSLGNPMALAEASCVLGFKERNYPGKRVIILGSLAKPEEVAENLYQALRQLDQAGESHVWVDMDFPREGLWQTIAERLMRAGESIT